jgi:hypothetical protein
MPPFKVIVNGSFVGTVNSINPEGMTLARTMAFRMGLKGGNIPVKFIDAANQSAGGASIYVS